MSTELLTMKTITRTTGFLNIDISDICLRKKCKYTREKLFLSHE